MIKSVMPWVSAWKENELRRVSGHPSYQRMRQHTAHMPTDLQSCMFVMMLTALPYSAPMMGPSGYL